MHIELKNPHIGEAHSNSADVCAVAVVYDDTATRDRAMLLCDHLVGRLWEDIDFEFSWWKFDYLRAAQIAADAAAAARNADMIIFSAHAARELTPTVRNWIGTWTGERENREGALVALIGTAHDLIRGASPVHHYLRDVAKRARMEYLSNLPEAVSEPFDVSVDAILSRATTVTLVMDRILKQASAPSHWGINE